MAEKWIGTLEDVPAAVFGLGIAVSLLASGVTLRAAHGDLAAFALSAAILWLAASLDHGGTRLEVFAFGLAVGIGGWESLPTLFCSALACAWLLLRWPAVERRRSFLLLVATGLLLGTLPRTAFHFPSLAALHHAPGTAAAAQMLADGTDEGILGSWQDGEDDSGACN